MNCDDFLVAVRGVSELLRLGRGLIAIFQEAERHRKTRKKPVTALMKVNEVILESSHRDEALIVPGLPTLNYEK